MSIFIPLNTKFVIIKYKNYNNIIIIYTNNRYISFYSNIVYFFKISNTIVINDCKFLSEYIANNYLTNYLCD